MPFTFRYQPFKGLYTLCSVIYMLASLPAWLALETFPLSRTRRNWPLKRAIIARFLRAYVKMMHQTSLTPTVPLSQFEHDANATGFVWVDAAPDLVVGEIKELAERNDVVAERTAGFWFGPRDADNRVGQHTSPGEKVVYHFHGGGHVQGSAHPKAGFGALYKGLLEYLGPNLRIFALEYRISSAPPFKSANPFPASLIDAIAGYKYLVQEVGFDPQNIILSGDSAGAGIALNLARYIASTDLPLLRQPGGLILLSPTMDWAQTHTGPESSITRNARVDFVAPILECGYTRRAIVGNLPEDSAAKSAWFSPGALTADWRQGMFSGFPSVFMVAGGLEYTLDPMRTVRDRLIADNGKERVTYVEQPEAVHDVLVFEWHEPERTEVLENLREWFKAL